MDMMSLRRRVMVNQNKLVNATGNPINFNTPLTKPLKECVVRFTPKQEGSGTPSPDNVREIVGKNGITVWQSGKNLFDYADGENIRIATSATDRKKTASSYGTITNDGNTVTLTRTLEAAGLVFILGKLQAGFTYTLSGTWDNIDNKAYIALLDTDVADEYTSTRKYTISFHYNSVSFTPEATGIYEVLLWRGGRDAISASNVQLEHGSTATAYEPFTASVETSVSFPAVGKNLFDISKADIGTNSIVFGGTGGSSIPDGSLYLEEGTYTASFNSTANFISAVRSNGIIIKSVLNNSSVTFTVAEAQSVRVLFLRNEATDMTAYQYQLEKGSTATAYEPFDNTIYGGYVDLVAGEVVAEWYSFVIDGTNYCPISARRTNDNGCAIAYNIIGEGGFSGLPYGEATSYSEVMADNVPLLNVPWQNIDRNCIQCGRTTDYLYLRVGILTSELEDVSSVSTIETSMRTWLQNHPIRVCYLLEEPIRYSLTPQAISTLRGSNVVWSDANGDLTVKYWTR